MRTAGIYLTYAAVVLRAAVVVSIESEFPVFIALLAGYGALLAGETWLRRRTTSRFLQSPRAQLSYLCLQSLLVIGALISASYEDFLALLFIPLSLDAVSFFGRRAGYTLIAIFSLAMIFTLLFSNVGPLFGLVMGILYSGICFLFGGYAHQVQKAEAARDRNQQMFNELQAAHLQLQGQADQLASLAIEQERNRLARELHDSVTQTVFSMNLASQSAHLLLAKDTPRASEQLLRLEELAASALREIQSLVSQLKPHSVLEEGLPAALSRLAEQQKTRNGFEVAVQIYGEGNLSERVTTGLYSIAQEALINAAKHSGVCDAIVRLNVGKDHSCLEIEDQGRGFNPAARLDQRGHLGLAGMFERAREIGWSLVVDSRPGQGTCIRVTQNSPGVPK